MNIDKLYILLLCNLGSSTAIMVSRMEETANKSEKLNGVDVKIEARPAGDLPECISDFDVVLIGPQIGHRFNELKSIADVYQKPIEIIDSRAYGSVNGGMILKQAILMKLNAVNS
ncbi:PTS sugar transporter subunit IIB [Bacillaceae bacterium SIJ1]|uniref:PTS sugar transporter subunit IIB n=1 Tax=Litoribacterium kuwaitense TaxID=1398745 RepID=UPI0013E9CAF9|nr:PTS sugar transporter subunit IIB [Litoribacterium kuwaitense]NGP46193.1 PTS sugar transporter subunit IIB [Litoribacterium kuwaitense]